MSKNTLVRRYILTINNPYWESEEIDIKDCEIINNHFNLNNINQNKDLFDFHYIYINEEHTKVALRPYFKNADCLVKYVENLEHIKYSMFQLEKGENGTEHIQMFLVFTIGKRFSTIKTYFPTAHFEDVKGSNVQCRDYCSKEDTRVDGPYEIGQFAEERSRTDVKSFIELIQSGADIDTLFELYPKLTLQSYEKIERIRQDKKIKEIKRQGEKNITVTYVYGPPGTGKTTWVKNQAGGYENMFRVTKYRHGTFDDYRLEDTMVFDEFSGQFSIEDMNSYLDIHPCILPARFANRVAVYHNVYIISNLKLSELYPTIQEKYPTQYQAFLRRIHNVVRIDKLGKPPIFEKSTQMTILSDADTAFLDEAFGNK